MSFRRSFLLASLCLASLFNAITADAAEPKKQSSPKDTPMPYSSTVLPSDLSLTYLANGLAVAVKKDPRFPLVSLRLYVHAGSAYETPDIAGISHQLEHMVFKGTEKRPKGAVATDIESAGGYLNAATSFDYTVYQTDMPSDRWKLGMDVLKDMAFHPGLDPDELESEKEVVLAELRRGEDSPANRLFKRIQASVLKGTPYERPIIGYPETIRAYTSDKIRNYIKALYQPQSMMLLVVGDVEPADVLAEAQRIFGGLENTATVVPPKALLPEEFPSNGPTVVVEETPWNKVQLSVSFPGVALRDARAPALDVYAQLLAGDTSAYLYKTYKYDKRLVDDISAASYTFERTGLFTITATLDPAKAGAFWEAFVKDLATIAQKKFTARELDRAKLSVTDSLYRQKETVAGTASSLGYFLFFGGGEDAEQTYLQQIDLVDQTAVTMAASSILKPGRLCLNVFLPKNTPVPAASGNARPASDP
ncbi:MAG: insulinase family protein, partial [Deltaproteobacteria bacterium]|nr:insulinase family protein [Deltaproteobacteria bacterium]